MFVTLYSYLAFISPNKNVEQWAVYYNLWLLWSILFIVSIFACLPASWITPISYRPTSHDLAYPSTSSLSPHNLMERHRKLICRSFYCMSVLLPTRLGWFGKPYIIQLFLGRYLIDIYEKLHSSPQNSKTRAGAGLEDINMDQSEPRSDMPGLWLVHIYIIKASSGPGLWVLWWTMQLFMNIYQGCPQK